jgi:putative ABC transport system permease protein
MRRHRGVEDFQIVIPQELIRQEQHAQKTFSTILAAIAVLPLLIGGVGIVNIMLAMVTERTQEIGIRRAVGANKTHILVQFLMEAVILTSIGTGLGLLLGIAAALLMSYFGDWNIVITLWSVLIAVGMSTLAGLLSGLYPAYVAANMDPIAALRLNG